MYIFRRTAKIVGAQLKLLVSTAYNVGSILFKTKGKKLNSATSSGGEMFYAGSLRGNAINFRGNTLTPVTSYIKTMTSSYLNDMYDVTGVNVFPPKVNGIPPQRTGVKHPSLTTATFIHVCHLSLLLYFSPVIDQQTIVIFNTYFSF